MSKKRTGRVVLCTLLVLVTLVLLAALGLWMAGSLIFNGPSEAAGRDLALRLQKSETTSWIPALFWDQQRLDSLHVEPEPEPTLPEDEEDLLPTTAEPVIEFAPEGEDPWAQWPEGVLIQDVHRRTYTAHVMLIKDPSQVYLATSAEQFSINIKGTRIADQMQREGAVAAINGGAFNDDGTASDYVGSLPQGMVVSEGKILWNDGGSFNGFVGLTNDNVLVVSDSITRGQVEEMGIRDGCCFGPVLIKDGQTNENVYHMNVGYNARTAIGQRADGVVIFACLDGRQAGSLGACYSDAMELMEDLGAVNACCLDGGASTVMTYRDIAGRYGKAGETVVCNSYALIQANPRRMPTFFMVRPAEGEE